LDKEENMKEKITELEVFMEKEKQINCIGLIEDCIDLIAKEIDRGLEPNKLLIDYIKEKLDLLKGE
jgi:hypothetical protein